MKWPSFVIKQRLANGLKVRFKVKSLLDITQKREEFIYKRNEIIKRNDKESQEAVEKYNHYIDTLSWVLNANL